MLRGCADGYAGTLSIPRSSQLAGHSGTVDILFTQFCIHLILDVSEFLFVGFHWMLSVRPRFSSFRKIYPPK